MVLSKIKMRDLAIAVAILFGLILIVAISISSSIKSPSSSAPSSTPSPVPSSPNDHSVVLFGAPTPGMNPMECCSTSNSDQAVFVFSGYCGTNQYCGRGSWGGSGSYCVGNCCSKDVGCMTTGASTQQRDLLTGRFYADNTLAVYLVQPDGSETEVINNPTFDWTVLQGFQIDAVLPPQRLKFVVTNSGGPGGLRGVMLWHGMYISTVTNNKAWSSPDGPIVDATKLFGDQWQIPCYFKNACTAGLTQWIWTADGCQNCTRTFFWDPSLEFTTINVYGNNGTCTCQNYCQKDWGGELAANTSWRDATCVGSAFNPAYPMDGNIPNPDCNSTGIYMNEWGSVEATPLICTCARNDNASNTLTNWDWDSFFGSSPIDMRFIDKDDSC